MSAPRRKCPMHGLFPRCPACEAELLKPRGVFAALEVPRGTCEWLLNAARFYASMGDEGAVEFALWISVDLREAAA